MSRLIKVYEPLEHTGGTERLVYRIQIARVDSSDYGRLKKYKWYAKRNPKTSKIEYVYRIGGLNDQCKFGLNREVLNIKIGEPVMVRHLNGDLLDCRRNNLKISESRRFASL